MSLLKKYHHISFDLDGTLVHTTAQYRHKIVPQVIKRLKGTVPDTRAIDKFWFEANRDTIIKQIFQLKPPIFWSEFIKVDTPKKRSLHTYAYDDAEPALQELKTRGKIISIITGAPRWIAQMEIKKLNKAIFDYCLSLSFSQFPEKPAPDSFQYVLNKLQSSPPETLYIGNSNEDAAFAKNAQVDFLYLERREHEFEHQDWAIATIHSLDELLSL